MVKRRTHKAVPPFASERAEREVLGDPRRGRVGGLVEGPPDGVSQPQGIDGDDFAQTSDVAPLRLEGLGEQTRCAVPVVAQGVSCRSCDPRDHRRRHAASQSAAAAEPQSTSGDSRLSALPHSPDVRIPSDPLVRFSDSRLSRRSLAEPLKGAHAGEGTRSDDRRLGKDERAALDDLKRTTGYSKSELVRRGLRLVRQDLARAPSARELADQASAAFAECLPPFRTCEAVIAEACFLMRKVHADGRAEVIAPGRKGAFEIPFALDEEHWVNIEALLRKYANPPTSLADACLIRCAKNCDEAP